VLVAQGPPGVGQHQVLHPPVVGRRPALDQAPGLQPVDDAGDVRRVAAQPIGQVSHGQGLVELPQGHGLGKRQVEGGRALGETLAELPGDPEQEADQFLDRGPSRDVELLAGWSP